MKKNIAFLIESELEKAEVVLAAKSITDAIQKMAESVAKMEAEDVMPLNDPIREHFGPEIAASFAEEVSGKLRELTQQLSEAKNAVSDAIARMQGEQVAAPADDLSSMDDTALDAEDDAEDAEAPAEDDFSLPEPEGDEAPAQEQPRFNADAMSGSPAGRARKESVEIRKPMLESVDRKVAREYAKLVREGATPRKAAKTITETYAIDIDTLVEIMESVKGTKSK